MWIIRCGRIQFVAASHDWRIYRESNLLYNWFSYHLLQEPSRTASFHAHRRSVAVCKAPLALQAEGWYFEVEAPSDVPISLGASWPWRSKISADMKSNRQDVERMSWTFWVSSCYYCYCVCVCVLLLVYIVFWKGGRISLHKRLAMTMAPWRHVHVQVLQTVHGWLGGLGIGVTQADPRCLDFDGPRGWSPGQMGLGIVKSWKVPPIFRQQM